MAKRTTRKPHEKGFTKDRIILTILNHPNGIEEPELRDLIRQKHGIKDKRGIKRHLSDLKQSGKIRKEEQKGKENIWHPKQDINTFKILAKEFLGTEHKLEFHKTPYCQNMITKHNNTLLKDNFKVDFETLKLFFEQIPYAPKKNPLLELLEEKTIKTLSFSPSALKFIMDNNVQDVNEKIEQLRPIIETELFFEHIYHIDFDFKKHFDETYAEAPAIETYKVINTNKTAWNMYLLLELVVDVIKHEAIKDMFEYTEYYAEKGAKFQKVSKTLEDMVKEYAHLGENVINVIKNL